MSSEVSLQQKIVEYMIEHETALTEMDNDQESSGYIKSSNMIEMLNKLFDTNQNLCKEVSEAEKLVFTPNFPFKTQQEILNQLLNYQDLLQDAIQYKKSIFPKHNY